MREGCEGSAYGLKLCCSFLQNLGVQYTPEDLRLAACFAKA